MAFAKKTWVDRDSEYPNRRSLTDPTTGTTEIRDIGLAEGDVYVEGTPLQASEWNDLEQRIEDAINEIPITEVEVTPVVTDGETLATIRVNEDTSDIKMPKPFEVKITYASGEYTADKTVAEIYAAAENGYEVYALYGMEMFCLASYSRSSASFISIYHTPSYKTSTIRSFSFRPNGTITLDSKVLHDLPSISVPSYVGRLMTVSSIGGENRYALTTDNTIDDSSTNAKRTYSSQKVNAELQARDAEIALKANTADVDTALALKADKADTYTKTQVDTALSAKANTSDVTASLALKADKADTYTKTEVDTALGLKADTATTYTKSEVDTALSAKANSSDLSAVATSGDYGDLLNKPTIPTATSQLTNDSDYQTGEQVSQAISTAVEIKADTDGTYEDMTVGTAMKLVATRHTIDIAPYLFRQSGGDNNAYVGTEETDKLVGASTVVNQLVKNGNFVNTSDWIEYRASASVSDNELTMTVRSEQTSGTLYQDISAQVSHKYLFFAEGKLGTASTARFTFTNSPSGSILITSTSYAQYAKIIILSDDKSYIRCGLSVTSEGLSASMRNYNLIDLTAMFGTAIADYVYSLEQATEGSGIAYLRKYGFFTKDYYPYQTNTLQSVNTSKHITTGKNQFNIDSVTVENITFNLETDVVTKNGFIYYLPRGEYTLSSSTNLQNYIYLAILTSNGEFKSSVRLTTNSSVMNPKTITLADGDYIIIYSAVSGTSLNINVFDHFMIETGSTATEYEPYVKHEYALPNIDLRGLYKLDASNNLYADGDTLEGDGTLTRKYEQRPYQSGDESLADAITDGTNTVVKLATPTTETATGFTNPQVVSKFGTEEYTDERDFPLPVGHETDYPLESEMALPVPPVTAGTYNLQLTVDASGNQTYSWAT